MRSLPRIAGLTATALGVVAVFAMVGTPASARDQHQVQVLDGNGQRVAAFTSARCRKTKAGFKLSSPRTASGYSLYAEIDDFSGFHTYDLTQGASADPWVSVYRRDTDTGYSNLNKPSFPSPGFGQIRFADHHRLVGIGYSPAYSPDSSDAVTFTGALRCHYKRR